MVFIPNGFGQATLVFTSGGPSDPLMVTFGYVSGLISGPDSEAQAIADAWSVTNGLYASQMTSVTMSEVRVLVRAGGFLFPGAATASRAGTTAGTAASPQVALLIRKVTGIAGRQFRGRFYLPVIPAPGADGLISAGELTNAQTRADNFLNALATESVPMRLLHTSEAEPPNVVASLEVQELVATQRRRLR